MDSERRCPECGEVMVDKHCELSSCASYLRDQRFAREAEIENWVVDYYGSVEEFENSEMDIGDITSLLRELGVPFWLHVSDQILHALCTYEVEAFGRVTIIFKFGIPFYSFDTIEEIDALLEEIREDYEALMAHKKKLALSGL
jgi:hypothetical protein